ncbi:long-chain-fatty-acid--CoA ligase [Nitratireductor sp. ZSWI3]|uniref:long-chain-fatty-acid--CoA ligase n=1 Tax=Nitratireductor sp. ZSWI3 TaxID=2966359 RepID=UPI00214FB432|nr:long-chain-fatty-acid--CoA ligase [Nitratireductor sp. ZSWI3]MCR4268485.1 long-chain-fatty-acid--CoA ligase [Nitratireductor sp. ZSWI3]
MAKTTKAPAATGNDTAGRSGTATKARATAAKTATKATAVKKTAPKAKADKAAAPKAQAPKAAAAKTTTKAEPAKKTAAKAKADKAAAAKAQTPKAAPKKTAAAAKPRTTKATAKAANGSKPSLARPWLDHYPDDIPAEIGDFPYTSLTDLLVDACRSYGDRPAFTCMGKALSYRELDRLSAHLAAYFQSVGLEKGARVALMMPNVLQYPVAMMAVLRAGYVVVNVNPLYTPRELQHQLNDAGAEAIVILENFAHTLQAVAGKTPVKHVVVASMGDLMGLKGFVVNFVVRRVKKMVPAWSLPGHVAFNDALKTGAARGFKEVSIALTDNAFLQYTGGTTGVSKGATLLHSNVLANVVQNEFWFRSAYIHRPRPEAPVLICVLPLYHIYALTVNALMGMKLGGNNVLIPNPRDIPAFVKELQNYDFHIFPGLNTLFNALLNNADFQKLSFKNLIVTFGGGMAVQRAVAERWQKLTGCVISQGYGLSETSPVATVNRFDAKEFTGTIGLPISSTDVTIRDDRGRDVPYGQVGEICIRGPQVMAGYWNRPDETAKVMTEDGFFRSGDMGTMAEDGQVTIVDRKKDMIVVSGFKVFPNEVEDVIAGHPGILEAAIVGVPDEHSGEVPKLFVVKKDAALTEADVLKFCKENLTGYKRPKYVEFRDELPKSNVGKILRKDLR